MALLGEKDLNRIIKGKTVSGAYYIYGADMYTAEALKKALVSSVLAGSDDTCNLHEFDGKGIDVEGISEACEALPMFAPAVCVTVRDLNLESERLSEARTELLLETVRNLPETTVLVFYNPNVDVCDGRKEPTSKNKKLIDAVNACGTVCYLPAKSRGEAAKLIISAAKKRGCAIDDRTAGMLWERCLGNMNVILSEVDKLCAYTAGEDITADIVERVTPEESGAKGFQLADAVAAGNIGRALQIYHELIDMRTEPVYLLYILMGSMNDLYRARLAIERGKSLSDTIKDFRYNRSNSFRIEKAFGSARAFDIRHLRRCMELLSKADIDMKSGACAPDIILEKTITQMVTQR